MIANLPNRLAPRPLPPDFPDLFLTGLHAAGQPGALASHTAALEIATDTGDRDEQHRATAGIARCGG